MRFCSVSRGFGVGAGGEGRRTLKGQRKVRQGHVVVVLTDVGAREQRGEGLVGQPLGGDRRHATKVVAGERGKLVVIDRAGGSQHHAGRGVVRLHVL